MTKMIKNYKMPSEAVETLNGQKTTLSELHGGKNTVLYFMRDSACVLAQYALNKLVGSKDMIESAGGQIIAVVRTSSKTAAHILGGLQILFPVICNVSGELYAAFGVGTAKDRESLGDEKTTQRIAEAKTAGFVHGEVDEGDALQLPAVFIINPDRDVRYQYYGKTGDDLPDISEITERLKSLDIKLI
jgi:peroxiredoxin